MKRYLLLGLAALPVLVTGCPHNEYVVELTPHGDSIERKLTIYKVNDNGPNTAPDAKTLTAEDIAAIKRLYSKGRTEMESNQFVATGRFSGTLPSDIGGIGSYVNLATTLGTAGFYIERFRGEDDLVAVAQRRSQAADQLADLLVGWAKAELGKEPNFENLRKFLDTNLRHDLKNVGTYLSTGWQFEVSLKTLTPEGVTNDVSNKFQELQLMRIGQYLVERGYLKPADLATMAFGNSVDNDERTYRLVYKLVTEKLGVPAADPPQKSLAFILDPELAEASWTNYFQTTEFYRVKVKEWERNKSPDSTEETPKPAEILGKLAFAAAGIDDSEIFETDDRLTVKLSLPSAPVESNGKWNDDDKVVHWENDLHEKGNKSVLPAFCFASWSEAHDAFQKKRFGKTVLTGNGLVQYCLWRSGLNKKQAAEWDAMISALQPGAAAKAKLESFRFTGQPATTNQVVGATLLNGALGP